MKQGILILKSDNDEFEEYYLKKMQSQKVMTSPYYINLAKNKLLHYVAVLWMQKLRLPFQYIWYGEWKKDISQYETIIFFDRIWGYDIIRYIHKKNKNCRLIFWYWNIIDKYNPRIPKDIREYCEEWSFDEGDCKKFGFKFNTQFYFWPRELKNKKAEGVFFVGRDKNRAGQLRVLKEKIEQAGVKTAFYIKKDDTSDKKVEYTNKNLSYYECIEKICSSECIVELNKKSQTGLTARALESIFFSKKLITDNMLVKEQPFYRENNILVYSENTTSEEIKDFLTAGYCPIPRELVNYYSFDEWIKRFAN